MRHLRAFVSPAKRLFLATLALGIAVGFVPASHALSPSHLWSQGFGGTSADYGRDVAFDNAGNVAITGTFSGTVNLGGSDLTSAGSEDIFLAKYNRFGEHLWSRSFGNASNDVAASMAMDNSTIVLVGSFTGTINFGGGDLVSAGGSDVFLATFGTATGISGWSQRHGGTSTDTGSGVDLDFGSPVITGTFLGTSNFGGVNLVSAGSNEVFVARYNSAGTHQWSQRFGGTSAESGFMVQADDFSFVIVAGIFQGTANFGGSNLVSAGGNDIFLARYNSAGVHQWSQRFGSTSSDIPRDVAVDPALNVTLVGDFNGTVNFGGGNLASAGGADIFLAKYNSGGTHQWSKRFGVGGTDSGTSVAVSASSEVVVACETSNTLDFGGGALPGAGYIYLAKFSVAGAHQWSARYGGGGDAVEAVSIDTNGNVLATGGFGFQTTFGGSYLSALANLDIFVVKFADEIAEPAISSIADIGNDQGRHVQVTFARSGQDQLAATLPVTQYECYRRVDAPPALASSAGAPSREALLATGWTQVGTVTAHGEPNYSIVAPTVGDSTVALGQYRSVFYVRAATELPTVFFDSPPDSGYSLDNLAPGVPENLVFETGDLAWDESSASDFDFFTVYGSSTDAFGASVVVDFSVAPSMDVSASPYAFYFVTATDFSGNEGKPAKVNTLSGVGGAPKSYVLSVSNYPNPFNPRTTVSYTVPSRGTVSISIYDTRGALVATLFNGERSAGAYTIDWDGRGQGGTPVGTGVYFARIEHASGTRTRKMVLLK